MKVLEQIVYLARLHGYSKADATAAPRRCSRGSDSVSG
jgi:ABC-type uncharacterized transport system ATPase subunit